ncbi:TetR/AcrR family transcriptional regulator [Streptomyces coacervatus]|uniref:TetR/AcrR family transcriptional regulator n=2 Tax=Streptomyces coacervatus TaxID=647381 RepID=A0ABP7IW81_9ACTN
MGPGPGRRREARRNDTRLLSAARDAFAELGWKASVSDIARRADVGMGTVYRRYTCKEELAQHTCLSAVDHLTDAAHTAAGEAPDGWQALVQFMSRALTTPTGSLLPRLGGRLPATDDMEAAVVRLQEALEAIVERAQDEGALRADVVSADVLLLLVHLKVLLPATATRAWQLRLRYLDVVLEGLRHRPPHDLDGPPPNWQELHKFWHAGPAGSHDADTRGAVEDSRGGRANEAGRRGTECADSLPERRK